MSPDLLPEFLTLASMHFLAMIAPGPDFALVIAQSVRQGRAAGIWIAAGIAAGLSVHILYTVLGVGALMHTLPWLLNVARALGAAYIAWIALHMMRAKPASLDPANSGAGVPQDSVRTLFLMGFFTNATNPKVTLFFLAIFTSVVSAQTPLIVQAGYGLWMCMVNMIWFSLVATLFSGKAVRQAFLRLGHWFERLMGLLLMLFALHLIADIIR